MPMVVFVRLCMVFSLVIITKGRELAVRGPADIHIESDRLHSGGAKLLALGLFVFVERRRVCRCTDLDHFWKE